jgi:outer membrane protein OmpA-like peptidoglycan-associated protein
MLVLFVLSFVLFKNNSKDLKDKNEELSFIKDSLTTSLEKLKRIVEIDSALAKLNNEYFVYNEKCKRHELKADIQFRFNKYDLNDTYLQNDHSKLISAGRQLRDMFNTIRPEDNIKYMLIIEGRAGRYPNESDNLRLGGRVKNLSYARAKSLYDFWESNGIRFNEKICEVIIAGSGLNGQCRNPEEIKNRRFVIQIIPKVGDIQ